MAGGRDEPVGRPGRVPRWALPGELAVLAGWPARRRTVRDWAVDLVLFGFAVVVWMISWHDLFVAPDPDYLAVLPGWMVTIDPWVGAAGCLALWWRRRFPLAMAVAMVPALSLSGTVLGAVLVSILTVAVHRNWLPATLVTAAQLAQAAWFTGLVYQPSGMSAAAAVVNITLMLVAPLGWGLAVRARRQVVVGLSREAQRERREHAQRLAGARQAERARIAREMHDVLAHRISLLSVHAGALAYRTAQAEAGAARALASEEVVAAVAVIRDSAHQALAELGEVLAVLRSEDPEAGAGAARLAPQPRLADLDRLVDEARAAGQRVDFDRGAGGDGSPGARTQEQRTAYRVVQEGLTNARKHAPAAQVTVRVCGAPGAGLEVAVTNPLPVGVTAVEIPGAGAGLTGLAERVALDGGTLEHGAVDGRFRLAARLPWSA
jgi:signal transduction histidine kinase